MSKRTLIFVVLAFLLLGGTAVAGGMMQGVVVGHVPTIASPGNVTLASIRYSDAGTSSLLTGNRFEVTLPAGMQFQTGLAASSYYEATSNLTVAYGITDNNRKITYTLTRTSFLADAAFLIKLPVTVTGNVPAAGDVVVTVVTNNPNIMGGNLSVGQNGQLAVSFSMSPSTVPVLTPSTPTPQIVLRTLTVTENGAGAFRAGTENMITMQLPRGVLWGAASYPVQVSPALPPGVTVSAVRENGDTLNLVLHGGTTASPTAFIIANPSITVSYLAAEGNIPVEVRGQGLSRTEILAATSAGWGVTVRRQINMNPFEVIAGRQNQAMANIEIVEAAPGSLMPGGTITFTLPEGLKFAAAPTAAYVGVKGTQPVIESNSRERTVTVRVTEASKATGSITVNFISGGNILVSPGFSGDVNVLVGGTAGAGGTVTLANAVKPVKVSAVSVTDIPGKAQTVVGGDIVIEELAAGRVAPGVIILDLPAGVEFGSIPSLTGTEGNLPVSLGALSNGGRTLAIPVNGRSTVAGRIVIGSINYRIANSWWDGKEKKIHVTVSGNSLADAVVSEAFTGNSDRLNVLNAEAGAARVSVFTIGLKTYTVGNQVRQMDQEPVIKHGRTMLPLRFVGEAIGLREEEILWDPVQRTVTLFRGNRVAQVTIGSRMLLINGARTEMDVAPEVINGRMLLPVRWIALALRVSTEWNETARTVALIPQ